jgi:hypothetical protein
VGAEGGAGETSTPYIAPCCGNCSSSGGLMINAMVVRSADDISDDS